MVLRKCHFTFTMQVHSDVNGTVETVSIMTDTLQTITSYKTKKYSLLHV